MMRMMNNPNMYPTQAEFIRLFTDNCRENFNEKLFQRSEDDIIEELKRIILSCQRNNRSYMLKVENFRVVEDYNEIQKILFDYEEIMLKNKDKTKRKDNQYEFVNLKDTDVKLLIVSYYVQTVKRCERLDVIIAVPRIVNKFYFKISGNIYSALYQIVEGSTYNNATSTNPNKKDWITLKSIFMPIKVYRNKFSIKTTKNEEVSGAFYTIRSFGKVLNSIKPFLAKLGFYNGLLFLGLSDIIMITQQDPEDDKLYTFMKNNIYLNVPKYIYDNEPYVQSAVYGIYSSITKECTYDEIFRRQYWLCVLGGEFSNFSVDKGLSILDSFESIYDETTKNSIHLPEAMKQYVYNIIRWMMQEFQQLKNKYNLDISTKRIRFAEYLASLYGMKLSKGLFSIGDEKKMTIDSIKKRIKISPMYLIKAITKCNLVNYRNMVNDLDAMVALGYTYKGVSGMGEKSSKSVPKLMRYLHPSHLTIVDPDASPKSDPGIGGKLCPMVDLYENNSFSDYSEPCEWEKQFNALTMEYKAMTGRKEVIRLKKELLNIDDVESEEMVDDSIKNIKQLFRIIQFVDPEEENKEKGRRRKKQ